MSALVRLLVALLFATTAWLLPAATEAQTPPPSKEQLFRAKKLFASGQELFADGKYGEAVERFLEAYDAAPLPGLLFNAAVAAHRSRQITRARDLLNRYLQQPPTTTAARAEVAKARALLTEIERALPGTLEVVSQPPGAKVFVDTASVGAVGTTPFRSELQAGRHLVVVELDGHAPERRQIEIQPGKHSRVEVALERGVGTLLVIVDVRGAQVLVDGQRVGQGPVATVKLKAGQYQVEVTSAEHQTWRRTTTVQLGQSTQLEANLRSVGGSGRSLRPFAWTSLIVGVVALGVGGGLTAVARSRQDELERARGEFAGANENLQDSGKALAKGAIASFVVGGAGVAGAVTLFLVDRARRAGSREAAPAEGRASAPADPPPRRWYALPQVGAGLVGASAGVEF